MELKTAAIHVFENGSTEAECPVDGDFLLPDYCPDIAAVLKCSLTPAVLSRRQSGDKLLIDGQSLIRVLYLDEERKCMRSFECVQPFSCSLPWEDATGTLPHVTVRVNYLNCRAVSPRRIDVHGALTATHHGGRMQEVQVLSDIAGEGIYTRRETVCCSVPAGIAEKNFSVSEVLDLGGGKPPAETIIRTSCNTVITSVKPMTDKAIVKGRVLLTTLYAVNTGDGSTCQTAHEIPFSQILDMEGMEEGLLCTAHADAITTDVNIAPDQNGQGTLLAVSIKLCVHLDAVRCEETPVITDAYGTRYPAVTAQTHFLAENQQFVKQDTTTIKEVLELPSDSMAEIVDLWCEIMSVSTRKEEDCTYADGHLQICMPARDRDGSISYYEHVSDFSLQYDDPCDRMAVEVSLCGTEYAIVGGKIEIRLELAVCRCGYMKTEHTALQQFEPTAEPYPEEKAALRICRVRKGASLWEIAKSCHTDMEAIMEENDLRDERVPEDCMLLVPLC